MKWLFLLGLPMIVACSGDDKDTTTPGDDDDDDDDTDLPSAEWSVEQVGDHSGGLQLRIAAGNSGPWPVLAYWSNEPFEDGTCDELTVAPPPKLRHTIWYAEKSGKNWVTETVAEPEVAFSPLGLDLVVHDDVPYIAFTGGVPEGTYCGGNDAVVVSNAGGTWTEETAADNSGQSATGMAASDAGFVVGGWPALAFDASGNRAVLHRDTHFGTLQHDDQFRADAELALENGGGWSHEAVDAGEGAGEYTDLLFDSDDRAVAFYGLTVDDQTESRHGLWASRREANNDFLRVKLHTGAIHQEVSAVVDGDALVVAYYSAVDQGVIVRRLDDPTAFEDESAWTSEIVADSRFDEGRHVSMALKSDGSLALAYHRCKRIGETGGCNPNDEAVIYATNADGEWSHEVVESAGSGSCGEYTSLTLIDDVPFIGFRCTVEEDNFAFRPFVATPE